MNAPAVGRMTIGIVVERRKSESGWIDFVWKPIAALPGAPEVEPWTLLEGDNGERALFYAGALDLTLHPSEAASYRDNLSTGAPALWVVLRATGAEPPYRPLVTTADPSEGEAYTESGDDLVDSVPMPEAIRAAVEAFVSEHYVDRPFYKRARTPADREAMAPRGPLPKEPKP